MGLYELVINFIGAVPVDPIVSGTVLMMLCAFIALDFFDTLRDLAFIFTKFF